MEPDPVPSRTLPPPLSPSPELLESSLPETLRGEPPFETTPVSMELDPVVAVQLVNQASHLRLSMAGANTETARVILPDVSVPPFTSLSERDTHPPPPTDAQRSAQTTPREAAIMGKSLPASPAPVVLQSVNEESGPSPVEMPLVPAIPRVNKGPGAGARTNVEAQQQDTANLLALAVNFHPTELSDLPNEVLLEILSHLDVCDLLSTSRTSHHLRNLSLAPILHRSRLRRIRTMLPPMLASPSRPSLGDLIARSIFLTHTTVVSRKLARSLVSIRLSRRLAARPSPETLVARSVLPPECVPGRELVAPAIVAKKRAVERERVKDGLRHWVGSVWKGEVRSREEGIKRWEERVGVGRVWRLRRFWERMSRGD